MLKTFIKYALATIGYSIHRIPTHTVEAADATSFEKRRSRWIKDYQITTVVDVGANVGEYAKRIRQLGFANTIISIEPLSEPFAILAAEARLDPSWKCIRSAVGDFSASTPMHIAGNRYLSSSLLPMCASHSDHYPESAYVGTETVAVSPLESLLSPLVTNDDRLWIKLDVQGLELSALRSAHSLIDPVRGVEMELSFVELYKGQPLFIEAIEALREYGFQLVAIEDVFENQHTGHTLQVNGIFLR